MYKVELPPESEIARPVRTLLVFRFWAVSVLYIFSFCIAVGALAFYLIQAIENKATDPDWKALLGFFGGSAGFGSYLVRLDRRERQSVERDEALYLLREQIQQNPANTKLQNQYQALLSGRAGGKLE